MGLRRCCCRPPPVQKPVRCTGPWLFLTARNDPEDLAERPELCAPRSSEVDRTTRRAGEDRKSEGACSGRRELREEGLESAKNRDARGEHEVYQTGLDHLGRLLLRGDGALQR
eukprot:2533558-Rhodomonas_salina.1